LTILCLTAPTDQRSSPKCLAFLDLGAKPDNMIVPMGKRIGARLGQWSLGTHRWCV